MSVAHQTALRGASRALGLAALAVLVASCASAPAPETDASMATDIGLDRMERLTLTADRCWFRSGDPDFEPYSLAPELTSFSGKPRFLLVPRGQMEARPLLVVEGLSGSSDVSYYGPLLNEPIGGRIAGDLDRWRAGSPDCNA